MTMPDLFERIEELIMEEIRDNVPKKWERKALSLYRNDVKPKLGEFSRTLERMEEYR